MILNVRRGLMVVAAAVAMVAVSSPAYAKKSANDPRVDGLIAELEGALASIGDLEDEIKSLSDANVALTAQVAGFQAKIDASAAAIAKIEASLLECGAITDNVQCGPVCADLQNDPKNCGACGVAVAVTQVCVKGVPTNKVCSAAGLDVDCVDNVLNPNTGVCELKPKNGGAGPRDGNTTCRAGQAGSIDQCQKGICINGKCDNLETRCQPGEQCVSVGNGKQCL